MLLQFPDMCLRIAAAVKAAGHRFGIDHLDINGPMQSLQKMQPNYVKVGAHLLKDLSRSGSSGAYQALRTLTSALDIQIIAVGVDTRDLFDYLIELGVDGLQGHLLGEAEALI